MVKHKVDIVDSRTRYGKITDAVYEKWTPIDDDGNKLQFETRGLRLTVVDENGNQWTRTTRAGKEVPQLVEYTHSGSKQVLRGSKFGIFMQIMHENYGWSQDEFDTDDLIGKEIEFSNAFWVYDKDTKPEDVVDEREFVRVWHMPISISDGNGEWKHMENSPQFLLRRPIPMPGEGTSDSTMPDDSGGSESKPLSYEELLTKCLSEHKKVKDIAGLLEVTKTNLKYKRLRAELAENISIVSKILPNQ